MDKEQLLALLNAVKAGDTSPDDALMALDHAPFDDLGYAKVDFHRGLRQGANEVIYGKSKTPEQIHGIVKSMDARGLRDILVTKLDVKAADILGVDFDMQYHPLSQVGIVNPVADRKQYGNIVIASGGTSDISVCEEAALTAQVMGNKVTCMYDVGVAGLHRLLAHVDELQQARVIIAVAGMEGALASVVGGLVSCPVIAVPTSVGYGANFGGLSALLSMLNSCASGVSVVNIDNGFGAGFLASRINKMGADHHC